MATLDISEAYTHMPIRPNLNRYLAFSYRHQLYFFQALPFGLNVAPYIFTKIMDWPLQTFRMQGVNIMAYLDDIILWQSSAETIRKQVQLTINKLTKMGFLINISKSQIEPQEQLTWLGILWHPLTSHWQTAPETRKKKKKNCVHNQTPPRSRTHNEATAGGTRWTNQLCLPSPLPFKNPFATSHKRILSTRNHQRDVEPHRQGSPHQHTRTTSSTPRHSILPAVKVPPRSIYRQQDGQVYPQTMRTKSTTLREELKSLLNYKVGRRIIMHTLCIPTELNVVADGLSCLEPANTEWTLPKNAFQAILRWAGPPQVDIMASAANHQLPQLVSPFPHPDEIACDCLGIDWNGFDSIYVFPPTNVIHGLIPLIRSFLGQLVLIAPWDPTAH